jgi:hypothetical protein
MLVAQRESLPVPGRNPWSDAFTEDKEEERKVRASLAPLKVKLTYGTD